MYVCSMSSPIAHNQARMTIHIMNTRERSFEVLGGFEENAYTSLHLCGFSSIVLTTKQI